MSVRTNFRDRVRKYRNADDLGFSSKVESTNRTLSKDGKFRVERIGGELNIYHYLIDMKWSHFILLVIAGYFIMSCLFALIYNIIGIEHIAGAVAGSWLFEFSQCYYFSAQTLTTVGYGALAPKGASVNFISSIEAVVGLLSFSLATGLFYGRFIKPRMGFVFSNVAVIVPTKTNNKLMVRVAYKQDNILLDLEVKLLVTFIVNEDGVNKRKYHTLKLESDKVVTMPLNWNIVHEVDESSPLYEMNAQDFKDSNLELILMIKGFSETYGQELHSRSSWICDEIIWNKKFSLPYTERKENKKTLFDLNKMDAIEEA